MDRKVTVNMYEVKSYPFTFYAKVNIKEFADNTGVPLHSISLNIGSSEKPLYHQSNRAIAENFVFMKVESYINTEMVFGKDADVRSIIKVSTKWRKVNG